MDMSSFDQYISLRQKQELALKPKMLQSLKMLSLPILELEMYIKQELVTNPLLELREEKDDEDLEDNTQDYQEPESTKTLEDTTSDDEVKQTLSEAKELTDILDQWNDFHQTYEAWHGDSDSDYTESLIRYEEDDKVKFLQQLYLFDITEDEYDFACDLVDNCDSYGFIPPNFSIYRLGKLYDLSRKRADEIHRIVLSLTPRGISARNISECLMAQLSDDQKQNRIVVGLITDQFENLIHRRFARIASHFGVSEDCIMSAREQVSKLDPKPGLRILSANSVYIYPDVTIKQIGEDYEVVINDNVTPNIVISQRYRRMINRDNLDKQTMSFVRERINSAKFLIKSIYMRMKTLERVALSIVKHQHDFFYNNSGALVPLTYSVIAQDLGVSESTISRVVKHKYAETPYGIYSLKDFFSSTAGTDDNYESISRQKVKNQIIKHIEHEEREHTLSDQELVEKLKEDGLNISRRIITKYRDEMGILNSRLRKTKS